MAHPKHPESAVLASQYRAKVFSGSRRQAENIIDLIGAQEVVGVLAVQVVVVDEAATHKQVIILHPPEMSYYSKYMYLESLLHFNHTLVIFILLGEYMYIKRYLLCQQVGPG